MKVTLDTNVIPADSLIAAAKGLGFEFCVTTVTDRELLTYSKKSGLPAIYETAVWGESFWGDAVWGSDDSILEDLLATIADGSFPPLGQRENLTAGQARQLRDAMILEAHFREKRDIFVTMDKKAFLGPSGDSEKRRQVLEREFKARIMTPDEFTEFCAEEGKRQEESRG